MAQYQTAYLALRNLPYSFGAERDGEGSYSGGVLRRGQTVWADEISKRHANRAVKAYLDRQGFILVDPTFLIRIDILRDTDA
jgi:hypothetical protein